MGSITLRNPANGEQQAVDAASYVVPVTESDAFYGWEKIADGLPLVDLQDDLWKHVKALRVTKKAAGVLVPNIGLVQTDDTSTQNINGLVTMAQVTMSQQPPFNEPFTLADNTVVALNATQMITLGVAVGRYMAAVYARARDLRAQIYADSATAESLAAIDITVGWP